MAATLFILNDPPYGTERSYDALRLAGALAKAGAEHVRVFLIGEGAVCASIFLPPIGVVARSLAPLEPQLTRWDVPGAAFLALSARKAEALS